MNHETHSGTAATRGYHVKTMPHKKNNHFFLSKEMGDGRSFK
jgi:hypothetical protein